MRTLVAWCPDWPITAAGFGVTDHVAVIEKGRVITESLAARNSGVRRGLRRREAESRCSRLIVLKRDLALEARMFEPIVAAIATLTPWVEVTRPGLLALNTLGPTRYFGGEESLCQQVITLALAAMPHPNTPGVNAGIADGRFAATLAAKQGVIVPSGQNSQFLSPFPLSVIGQPDIVDLLSRLGIHTLGDFCQLPQTAVFSRFGNSASLAHSLARGTSQELLRTQILPQEMTVSVNFDPPADRAETAAFIARPLADDLVRQLRGQGHSCALLRIEAETEHGESLVRLWRLEDEFSSEAILERLRWQLDGWLSGSAGQSAPTAGLTSLVLVVDEVLPTEERQLDLWGETSTSDRRAVRGLDRLRGMLGPSGVLTAVLNGGRRPLDRVAFLPWGELRPTQSATSSAALPWPGHQPFPAPALVYPTVLPVEVIGEGGKAVVISGRGHPSESPSQISISGSAWSRIIAWNGPWTSDERWWDQAMRRRQARFQILTENFGAHLCVVEEGRWWIEASYD